MSEQAWADQRAVDALTIEPASVGEVARRLGSKSHQRLQRRLNRLVGEGRIGSTRINGTVHYMIGGRG